MLGWVTGQNEHSAGAFLLIPRGPGNHCEIKVVGLSIDKWAPESCRSTIQGPFADFGFWFYRHLKGPGTARDASPCICAACI